MGGENSANRIRQAGFRNTAQPLPRLQALGCARGGVAIDCLLRLLRSTGVAHYHQRATDGVSDDDLEEGRPWNERASVLASRADSA